MKTKFGYMTCPDCKERVAVKINDQNETLSYLCTECDSNGYCKKGEGRYDAWLQRITRTAAPAPQPKPGTPAPVKKKSVMDDII